MNTIRQEVDTLAGLLKRPHLYSDIPNELFEEPVLRMIHKEYGRQTEFVKPSLKSVLHELMKAQLTDDEKMDVAKYTEQIKKSTALEWDDATFFNELLTVRRAVQFKLIKRLSALYDLGTLEPRLERQLNKRIEELNKVPTKAKRMLPVSAIDWSQIERDEIEQMKSGIEWLEQNRVTINKKTLYLLVGMTNGGKTIVKTWFAYKLLTQGYNILWLAQEEPYTDTIRRIHQQAIGMTDQDYREASVEEEIRPRFTKWLEENRFGEFWVAEWPGISTQDIELELELFQERVDKPVDILFIDYSKQIQSGERNRASWEEIGKVFEQLKAVAMRKNIAIFTSVQINREASERLTMNGKTPQLTDISGAYEAAMHTNYAWGIFPKPPRNSEDSNPRYGADALKGYFKLQVLKSKYGDLRDGDSQTYEWYANNTLVPTDEIIEMTDPQSGLPT